MWILLVCGATLICNIEARKIRIQPISQDADQDEDTVQYFTAEEPKEAQEQGVVYVAAADQYNGLFGQPTASPRSASDNYLHVVRSASTNSKSARLKEAAKSPPVQTIRNYNKVNDDGSFTFGYEAADGSFKEETRGTDCVVRGKYGYVDPDGNKREFTYVSGNPCDPNAPKEEDELPEEDSKEPENVPPNYPIKPIKHVRPVTPAPKPSVVTVFQNNYQQDEDVQPEPEQLLKPHSIQAIPVRPQYIARPQFIQAEQDAERFVPQGFRRGHLHPETTLPPSIYKQSPSPVNITPRPITSSSPRPDLLATTYRPQVQIAVTPKPSLYYTKELSASPRPIFLSSTPSPVPVSATRGINFDSEFQRFQHDNNYLTASPSPLSSTRTTPKASSSTEVPSVGGQVYSSELVFDPATGLYNTQLYQALPQTDGDFTLSQRIQPYVFQPPHLLGLQGIQPQNPFFNTVQPQPSQAYYQQQQAELQFQNSAQLYAQQQQQRAKVQAQQVQTQRPRVTAKTESPQLSQKPQQIQQQQYYYIQPTALSNGGQIVDFLQGHNIQF